MIALNPGENVFVVMETKMRAAFRLIFIDFCIQSRLYIFEVYALFRIKKVGKFFLLLVSTVRIITV